MIALVKKDGWSKLPGKATAHRQFKHPSKPGRVTVSGNLGDDVAPGTLRSILRQAGLTERRP